MTKRTLSSGSGSHRRGRKFVYNQEDQVQDLGSGNDQETLIQDLPVDKETKAAVRKFLKGNKNRFFFLKLVRECLCDNPFMDDDQAEREPFQGCKHHFGLKGNCRR